MAGGLRAPAYANLLFPGTRAEPFFVRMELGGEGVPPHSGFTLRVNPAWAPLGVRRAAPRWRVPSRSG